MKYFYLAMCMLSLVTSIALKLDGDSVGASLTFIKALLWLNLFWITMVWEKINVDK